MQSVVQGIVSRCVLGLLSLAAISLAGASPAAAADPADNVIGTWSLNVAKSSFGSGHILKSQTRTYRETADGVALDVTTVEAGGTTVSQHSIFKYDGNSYAMSGSADYDAISLLRVDADTVNATLLRAGKPVGTTVRTLSKHGTILTLATKVTGASGKRYATTLVFDRR